MFNTVLKSPVKLTVSLHSAPQAAIIPALSAYWFTTCSQSFPFFENVSTNQKRCRTVHHPLYMRSASFGWPNAERTLHKPWEFLVCKISGCDQQAFLDSQTSLVFLDRCLSARLFLRRSLCTISPWKLLCLHTQRALWLWHTRTRGTMIAVMNPNFLNREMRRQMSKELFGDLLPWSQKEWWVTLWVICLREVSQQWKRKEKDQTCMSSLQSGYRSRAHRR